MAEYSIIGTGKFAVELFYILSGDGHRVLGFWGEDSGIGMPGTLNPIEIGDKTQRLEKCLIAIGDPQKKKKVARDILSVEANSARYCHASSWIAENVEFGIGTIIYPHCTVHSNVSFGRHVFINSNVSIGHDTKLKDFVSISPGARIAGCVEIGTCCYLGQGSVINENLVIADDVIIGSGCVVVEDIKSSGTYVGVPARKIR